MTYRIAYGKHIDLRRFRKIPKNDRQRILLMIEQKLREHPEIFGKPLRKSLIGHRSLRVGEYRVIFRIQETRVIIELIGHRSTMYPEAGKLFS